MAQKLKCPFLMFADDLKIYVRIRSLNDCYMLQHDLNILYNWSIQNGFSLNINKCHYIAFSNKLSPTISTYSINNVALTEVNNIKDLGVILDSRLKFDKSLSKSIKYHIQSTNKKLELWEILPIDYNAIIV